MSLKVICIDDSNRPNDVPLNRWVKVGEHYTIIKIMRMKIQNGLPGVKLAEINNDDLFPYTYFDGNRFAMDVSDLMESNIEVEEIEYV